MNAVPATETIAMPLAVAGLQVEIKHTKRRSRGVRRLVKKVASWS